MVLIIKTTEAEKIGNWKTRSLNLHAGSEEQCHLFYTSMEHSTIKLRNIRKRRKKINKKLLNRRFINISHLDIGCNL